jgi:hypothetical protein
LVSHWKFIYEHGVRIFVKILLEILFGCKNDDVTNRQVQKMKENALPII